MKQYLKLIGWQSLLLVLIYILMVRASITLPFYKAFCPMTIIPSGDYLLFAFGLVLMMASLNVICFYFDTKMSDIIGGVKTENNSKNLRMFYVFAVLALGAEIFLSVKYHIWQLGAVSLMMVGLSYIYALKYKRQCLTGNVCLSLLYGVFAFMPFLLEFFAFTNYSGELFVSIPAFAWLKYLKVFVFLAGFAALLTFVRDITADLANREDNAKAGFETVAVRYGEKKTCSLLYIAAAVFMVCNAYVLFRLRNALDPVHIIILIVINIAPMIYYFVSVYKSKRKEEISAQYLFLGMVYISLLFNVHFMSNIFLGNAL